jgi:hypothetical protein
MATHTGKEGILKIGANAVAEIVDFTITESAETVDDTCKGDDWRTKKLTFKSWNADAKARWVEDDTNGQDLLTVGASVTAGFYVMGEASGARYREGTALITERAVESALDGLVELSLSFEGTGELTDEVVT